MAKKNAASAKIVKPQITKPLEPIEEIFNDAREMFILTVETQVKTSKRIDNLANIRDLAERFWGDRIDAVAGTQKGDVLGKARMSYYKRLHKVSIKAYEDILECSKKFSLEEFSKDQIKDYYENLIPKAEDLNDEQELIEGLVIFLSVQPYGGKMLQLHQLIQDELSKRGE